MPRRLIVQLVHWCWRHALPVLLVYLLATLGLAYYAGNHLSLDTDESHMISARLPFRQAEQALDKAFPQNKDLLVAVIDGPLGMPATSRIAGLTTMM